MRDEVTFRKIDSALLWVGMRESNFHIAYARESQLH
jgi:hypothetical protein